MPREIEPQANQHAQSPHAPRLEDQPDSAYGQHPAWDEDLNFEPMSRGEYSHLQKIWDTPEHQQLRHDDAMDQDEESGYNWGPAPDEEYLHGQLGTEHQPEHPEEFERW